MQPKITITDDAGIVVGQFDVTPEVAKEYLERLKEWALANQPPPPKS